MKKLLTVITASFMIWGCNSENSPSTGVDQSQENGSAQISVLSGQIGRLAKTVGQVADIEMDRLVITLTAEGEAPIEETFGLSGNGQSQVIHTFNNLTPLKTWTAVATSYDLTNTVIHQGSSNFDVYPGQTNQITLDLEAQYSMLKATFAPITDSVTSLHLLVDGIEVATQAFAPSSTPSAILDWDYLPADGITSQNITMQAKGSYWQVDYTLYEGTIDIVVTPGQDAQYVVTLVWVGPGEPPVGAAEIIVNLGAVGTVEIDGQIEEDPFNPIIPIPTFSAVGFNDAFDPTNWNVSGVANPQMSNSTIGFATNTNQGGGFSASIIIPADGVITFDWTFNVYANGQPNQLNYNDGVNTVQLSTSTGSGSVTGVAVSAGDTFSFSSWGSTSQATHSGSIGNFTFTEN